MLGCERVLLLLRLELLRAAEAGDSARASRRRAPRVPAQMYKASQVSYMNESRYTQGGLKGCDSTKDGASQSRSSATGPCANKSCHTQVTAHTRGFKGCGKCESKSLWNTTSHRTSWNGVTSHIWMRHSAHEGVARLWEVWDISEIPMSSWSYDTSREISMRHFIHPAALYLSRDFIHPVAIFLKIYFKPRRGMRYRVETMRGGVTYWRHICLWDMTQRYEVSQRDEVVWGSVR